MSVRSVRVQFRRLVPLILVVLLIAGALPAGASAQSRSDTGATTLTGSVTIPPDQLAYFSEPYAILMDISTRFENGAPDLPSQVLAGLEQDGDDFDFTLALPIEPAGRPVNVVDENTDDDPLLFTIDIVTNSAGTPFLEETDALTGSPATMFTSFDIIDDQVTGQLAIWSDGEGPVFPTDVGDDGVALTPDDPTTELEAGWTIVDLGESPYVFSREAHNQIAFPSDLISGNDFSKQGWSDAFAALIDQLEAEYAFSDLKEIDYDELRDRYLPRVEKAEAAEDLDAYTLALFEFGLEFNDGHVSASLPVTWIKESYGGGYGLTLGQADDGAVYATDVVDGSPADEAGIEPGDRVKEWDGDGIAAALDGLSVPVSLSSESELAIERVRWLTRAPVDATVEVEWTDADGDDESAELTADDDLDGLIATLGQNRPMDYASMPIESRVLDSGVGYIRINSFYTDQVLFTHQWDYALRTFETLGVTDLVIDVRGNSGGWTSLPFYAARSFVDDSFVLDQAYVADGKGGYVYSHDQPVTAGDDLWQGSVAVVVDGDCISACEMFSAILAATDDDDITIVGSTPSGGVYATIEDWSMPEDLYFQASYIRYQGEGDDDVFVEGEGVPPDIDVPVTRESLLSPEDEVLEAAEVTVLK